MPVYEYVCTPCRNRFEKMRPMDTYQEGAPCPDCGSPAARALSAFAAFTKSPGGEMVPMSGYGGGDGGGGCGCGDSYGC